MSDITGLHGVFPQSVRWNAEEGFLSHSIFDAEAGERELREIELGEDATFVLDLLTRERGYGLIKTGVFDMRLTPVGTPPPLWPGDDEFKAAVGCWFWNPALGEVRLETNAALLVRTISKLWDDCHRAPEVGEGEQPVIRFVDRRSVKVASVNKTFFVPVIKIIGGVARDKVPGWAGRPPTVLPPPTPPILLGPSAPRKGNEAVRAKLKRPASGAVKRGDSLAELLDDDLPDDLK